MSNVIIYTTEDGVSKIELRLENGTVWLSQLQIAELFQTSKQNINKHIQSIYDDHELDELATVNQQLTVQIEGRILPSPGRKLLENAGKISHNEATEKAKLEYQKYKAKTLNNVEKDYLKTIAELEKQAKAKSRNEGTEP